MAGRPLIRALPLLAVLMLVAGFAGATDYLAIGDSNMAGSSWPATCATCPVVFDCTGGCAASSNGRESCGLPRRLENWLGGGNDVINEGLGAELTSAALSRINSEMNQHCSNPAVCSALILMHGTNDLNNNISPETARNNLEGIIDHVKGRDVDVLLMSVIRKVFDRHNTDWQDYRDLLSTLANTKDLQFVDTHDQLCDTASCYHKNYYIDADLDDDGIDELNEGATDCTAPTPLPGEGDNGIGHLDPDGFSILTDMVQDEFPGSTPGAPNPTSPSGSIMDSTPDFVWPEIGSATWYQLEVDGAKTWWEEAADCAGGTCTVNPGVVLSEGAHSWRVRGRNLRGMGAWSASENFSVDTLVPPGETTPTGPVGPIFEAAPEYTWTEVPTATEYDLEVRDAGSNLDASAVSIDAATACAGSICSFVEGSVLSGPDDYTIKLIARNSAGDGPLSSPGLTFSVLECVDASVEDLEQLEPSPVTTTETVERCGAVTAGAMGAYRIDASGSLTIHTRDGFTAFDGFEVRGELSVTVD